MRNIKLVLEYDGTSYVGWQRQANGKSIQGEIEDVLFKVLQEKVDLIGAGRTDAGVHARGQVANFRTDTKLDLEAIRGALNGLLPDDIILRELQEAPLDFHARFNAKERFYSYFITLKPSAFQMNYSWHIKYRLNVTLMKRAADLILGTHDFESFCKADSEVDHYRCTVSVSCWSQEDSTLTYKIRANRFLHNMVRALVGTMVDVGRGYLPFDDFPKIVERKDRKEAGVTAPAKGLFLESVIY